MTLRALGWGRLTIKSVKHAPKVVKLALVDVLKGVVRDLALPVQSYMQLMAILGKKDGGTRCIALCDSLYRILMAILGDEVREWADLVSMENDTAMKGKSPMVETAYRQLKVEMYTTLGYHVAVILWDIRKYFDSLDVPTLVNRAQDAKFPMEQLVLSMQAHRACRIIRMEGNYSDTLPPPGKGIIAGCKTSTFHSKCFLNPVLGSIPRGP